MSLVKLAQLQAELDQLRVDHAELQRKLHDTEADRDRLDTQLRDAKVELDDCYGDLQEQRDQLGAWRENRPVYQLVEALLDEHAGQGHLGAAKHCPVLTHRLAGRANLP